MPSLKERIIKILTEDKFISNDDLNKALKIQKEKGGQLSAILIDLKLIQEDKLFSVLSRLFSKPTIDISRFKITPEVLKLVPANICKQYQIIPISKFADTITLAMADPLNILALDDVKILTGYKINPIIADARRINEAVEQYYGECSKDAIEGLIQGIAEEKIELIQAEKEEVISASELSRLSQEAPVASFTNKLLEEAISLKSSDILIEPQENILRIRFRIDGILKVHAEHPKSMSQLITTRIKVISGLNIAEHRLPQDGRFKIRRGENEVDFRVSVLPSNFGEKVAIRILDKAQVKLDIEKLGFQDKALFELKRCAFLPHGMILACGPTGSGKTTTLYSLIKLIDRPKLNIITVEDPVEFQMPGINQVNVNSDIGLTFASVLRSILRQDPNVIMVGEIRDFQTVDIAIKAALTGHLVFSTLHSTTTSGAVVRLVNMGVEPFLIVSAVTCIVAQRLVRVLCPNCKEKYELSDDVLIRLKVSQEKNKPHLFFRPKGCKDCFNTGYRGRMVLGECLILSPKIKELILNRAQEYVIKQAARCEGMLTLREDGISKAKAGITSLEEVLKTTGSDDK